AVGSCAVSVTLWVLVFLWAWAGPGAPEDVRTVVVLYPERADGRPANELTDHSLRAAFATAPEPILTRNEYLLLSRFQDAGGRKALTQFLKAKYANDNNDLVIAVPRPAP